jgi:PGF-pre-PGF domain-containing protein
MNTNRIAAVVFTVLMVTSVVAVPWTAAAQEEQPEGPPASYYGSVTIDGEPAPTGTTIEAVVDGDVVGSITTNESGQYGGPGLFEDKLLVSQTDSIENGSELRFFVDNGEIERTEATNTDPDTVKWESGDVQEVDLTFENVPDSDDTSSGGGGGGADDADGPDNSETVTLAIGASEQNSATFEAITNVESVTVDSPDSTGDVTVTDLDPETTDDPPAPGRTATRTDISVPADLEDAPATIRFRVSNERLDAIGATAESLRAFRLVDGEWQRLELNAIEETGDGIIVEARTPGFSVFAVSAVTPPTGEITLNPEAVTVGDEITLSASGSSDSDGEIVAYEWSVDGESFTGETTTVALDEPGEYSVELAVTDDAGETDTVTETLVVEAADTETTTPEPDAADPDVESPTEGPAEEAGAFDPLPVVIVAVVFLLGAGYVAYRRRAE